MDNAAFTGPVIDFRDVRKVHAQGRRDVVALDGVSLQIGRREFVTIMGPSGSGKSTLLHLAGGLDVPSSGEVLLEGRSTSKLDDTDLTLLRRRQIGFVFQFFNLIPSLNIVQNASLPALLAGTPAPDVKGRAEDLLRRMGLEKRLDHFPEELSGGEMQRVAIARALITDPPIVLADEPTGNLDTATGIEILKLLQDIGRERTVVIVTHDDRAAGYGTRLVRLRDGKLA
jgi:putative ABC transport system ATP-binding protein